MIPNLQLLDTSFEKPAHNLACDEALLDELEAGYGAPTLRFWEAPEPFVVVGYANKIASEVNIAACRDWDIPILRRSSGGGAVVQGYGCLNYNLTLPITDETATITDTNCFIMRRHRDAIAALLRSEAKAAGDQGSAWWTDVQIQGHTDLTLGDAEMAQDQRQKFSGNAQRRRSRSLMFHGCFLLDIFNASLIHQLLLHPTREPSYRAQRNHLHFLTGLSLSRERIKTALASVWNATEKATIPSHIRIEALVAERFGNREWNEKF